MAKGLTQSQDLQESEGLSSGKQGPTDGPQGLYNLGEGARR